MVIIYPKNSPRICRYCEYFKHGVDCNDHSTFWISCDKERCLISDGELPEYYPYDCPEVKIRVIQNGKVSRGKRKPMFFRKGCPDWTGCKFRLEIRDIPNYFF